MPFPYDSTGVETEKVRKVAPFGDYNLTIEEVSEEKDGMPRTTKIKPDGTGGDPYVNVKCSISDGEYAETVVYNNVTFMPRDKKGAGIAVHFLKTIGEPWEGQFDVIPQNWVGKKFRARLNNVKDPQGRPKNEIAFVYGNDEVEVPF